MNINSNTFGDESPVLLRIERLGIVPVIANDDDARAEDLADALVAGGLPTAEATLCTRMGLETILRTAGRGDKLVGAGTVLTVEKVDCVVDAGASFVVSSGLSLAVVKRCHRLGVAAIHSITTAADLQTTVAERLGRVKRFPPARWQVARSWREVSSTAAAARLLWAPR